MRILNLMLLGAILLSFTLCSEDTSESIAPGNKEEDSLKDNNNKPNEKFHLYLLIGQSNMSGRGPLIQNEVDYTTLSDERIKMFTEGMEWVTAKHPIHFDYEDAAVGPGLEFAMQMLEYSMDPEVTIGLIPAAVGGSNIGHWEPEKPGNLYHKAMIRTTVATTNGVLKGVLFHQGEANISKEDVGTWSTKVKEVISGLRSDFKNPELPFIMGEIGYFVQGHDKINSQIPGIVESMPRTIMISAEGLEDKGDNLHFDSPSATLLGQRYAEGLQELLEK